MGRIRELFLAHLLCALWASSPAHAEPLRAGLRLTEPADASLLERVRGQTGDLDVALQGIPTAPTEVTFAAQLEAARELADEQGLRVLIWAVRHGGALELVVADFALDRVLVRPLSFGSSAQEEAAALVARSALRASLAGTPLGQPSEELAPEEPVAEEPTPPPPVQAPREEQPWRVGQDLGALSGLDGGRGHHALFVQTYVQWRWLEVGALVGFGMPVRVDERLAKLRLATHRLEANVGLVLRRGPWSLVPALAIGARRYVLKADVRDARLETTNAHLYTLALGAFVRVGWQPKNVGISLRLGAFVLPNPPQLGYQADDFVRTQRLWPVQPELGLAVSY